MRAHKANFPLRIAYLYVETGMTRQIPPGEEATPTANHAAERFRLVGTGLA